MDKKKKNQEIIKKLSKLLKNLKISKKSTPKEKIIKDFY